MRPSKLAGYLMVTLSPVGFIIYTLWFFGLLQGLDPELAVRVVAYAVAAVFFGVVGALGYIVITAPAPKRREVDSGGA